MGGLSGPAPKHASLRARRNAPTAATLMLPGKGCKMPAPEWPLLPERGLTNAIIVAKSMIEQCELALHDAEATSDHDLLNKAKRDLRNANAQLDVAEHDKDVTEAEELKLWAKLWTLPQAEAWHRLGGYTNEVAQYVRWKVLGELGDLKASKEARLLANTVGLSPAAMLKLRWDVSEDVECQCELPAPTPTRARRGRAPAKKATPARPAPKRKAAADPRSGLHLVE